MQCDILVYIHIIPIWIKAENTFIFQVFLVLHSRKFYLNRWPLFWHLSLSVILDNQNMLVLTNVGSKSDGIIGLIM